MKDKSLSREILIAIILGNLILAIVLIATQNIFSAKITHLVILLVAEMAAILTYRIVRYLEEQPDPEELNYGRRRRLSLWQYEGARYGEYGTGVFCTDIIHEKILQLELRGARRAEDQKTA